MAVSQNDAVVKVHMLEDYEQLRSGEMAVVSRTLSAQLVDSGRAEFYTQYLDRTAAAGSEPEEPAEEKKRKLKRGRAKKKIEKAVTSE